MPAILDALRGRMKQREENALDTFAAAARAAARGEAYDVAAIERAIVELGKTPAEFEAAVAVARKRVAWLADVDKLSAATAKVNKLEASAATEKAKFEAARRAFIEKAEAIDADLAAARATQDRGRDARTNLLDPRGVPGTIGHKYREAVAEAEAATATLVEAQRTLREVRQRVKSEREWIASLTGEDAKEIRPRLIVTTKAEPGQENPKLEEHRLYLARALRRQTEAEARLTEAEKAAAAATRTVDSLAGEVLKS
jgi:hypothetical protein